MQQYVQLHGRREPFDGLDLGYPSRGCRDDLEHATVVSAHQRSRTTDTPCLDPDACDRDDVGRDQLRCCHHSRQEHSAVVEVR